jgi:hypothetical protein
VSDQHSPGTFGEPLRQSVVVTTDRMAMRSAVAGQLQPLVDYPGYFYVAISEGRLAFLAMEPAGLAPTGDVLFACSHDDVASFTIDKSCLNASATITLNDGSLVVLAVGRSQLPRLRSLVHALHLPGDERGRRPA